MKKLTPVLLVEELQPSIEFYRGVLGFEVKTEMPLEGFAALESGDVEVMLETRKAMTHDFPTLADAPAGGGNVLYFETEDVDSLRRRVEGRTRILTDLRDQPYGMREFVVSDPSGNLVTLATALPPATAAVGAGEEATA
jgi:uncharacterized glyoxalase superfamily protein PhnB